MSGGRATGDQLTPDDEDVHPAGPEPNWNESRYVDVFDRAQGVSAWLRLGNRPNEGRAEVSVSVSMPDGRTAFAFRREPIKANCLAVGGQTWHTDRPFLSARVSYDGPVHVLEDPWALTEPRRALAAAPVASCRIDLQSAGCGLESVLGFDQDHVRRIFLPGQAAWHYQHLVHTIGTVRVDDAEWEVDGGGGRDHSWGPRNWHAKRYFRWLVAHVSDDFGFMLTRAVGSTSETRSGFVWTDGRYLLVDDLAVRSSYAGAPHYEVRSVEVTARSGAREWHAQATPEAWLPLRHTQPGPDGVPAVLRIVKSPARWAVDGRVGEGMLEYHDLVVDGRPVGLAD